jgi:ABC-type sugar transport system substrate-binding protein
MFSRKRVALLAAAVTALTLAGCSSSSSGSGGANGTSNVNGTSSANGPTNSVQTKAKAYTAKFEQLPTKWPGSTTSFNPGSGRAAVLICGLGAPACVQAGKWAVQALHAMGWQASTVDGQFSPKIDSNFMDRAAADHLDGVVVIGPDVNTIAPATQRAVDAGVKVVCVWCVSGPKWAGKVVDVTPNWVETGKIAAMRAIANHGADTKAVTFYDPQVASVRLRAQGVKDGFKEACPQCKLDLINTTGADLSLPGPPQWNAFLASHPNGTLTDVIGESDGLALVIGKTDEGIGRSDITVGGFDGDLPNLTAMTQGKLSIDYSVAHGTNYEAWTAADVLGRWKAGADIPANLDQMPNMLVTKDNAAELIKGNPKGSAYPAPAGDWQSTFLKNWGKS